MTTDLARGLSPQALPLFTLLGLHPGSQLTVDAAAALLGAAPGADGNPAHAAVTELVTSGLLIPLPPVAGRPHVRITPGAGAYASRLAGRGGVDLAAARERIATHYARSATDAALVIDPHHQAVTTPAACDSTVPYVEFGTNSGQEPPDFDPAGQEDEWQERREALAWLETAYPVLLTLIADPGTRPATVVQLANTLKPYWELRPHHRAAARDALCRALAAAQAIGDPRLVARMLAAAGLGACLDDPQRARLLLAQASELYAELDADQEEAALGVAQGHAFLAAGAGNEAAAAWQAAIPACLAVGERRGAGQAHLALSELANAQSDYVSAAEHAATATALLADLAPAGDLLHLALATGQWGNAAAALGDVTFAHEQWTSAIALLTAIGAHTHAAIITQPANLTPRLPRTRSFRPLASPPGRRWESHPFRRHMSPRDDEPSPAEATVEPGASSDSTLLPAAQYAASRHAVWSAAAVLFTDEEGRILIEDLDYRDTCLLPGGAIDAGETPTRAAIREVREELGLIRCFSRVLAVDWSPPRSAPNDPTVRYPAEVVYVFDGGVLTEPQIRSIRLPYSGEVTDICFTEPALLGTYMKPVDARRAVAALLARINHLVTVLQDGVPTAPTTLDTLGLLSRPRSPHQGTWRSTPMPAMHALRRLAVRPRRPRAGIG